MLERLRALLKSPLVGTRGRGVIKFSDVVGAGEETRTFRTKLSTLIKDRQLLMVSEKV